MGWQVEIRDIDTDEIIEVIECSGERSAERVENGVNINLNKEKYYTEVSQNDK